MVKNFRCGELQTLLSYAGQQKSGKKAELVSKVERIIADPNRPPIFVNKILELYSYEFFNIGFLIFFAVFSTF